jgi:adenylosuccinate lyase
VEVRHLQRTEVREAEENFTKGQKGSSAMPHKRNPILSENITGLARLIRAWAGASLENVALWHERDISHSSVERVIAPDITVTLDFMLGRVQSIVENLVVYPENMRRNLDLTQGLIFSGSLLVALEKKGLPRDEAYQVVQQHALAAWDYLNEHGSAGGEGGFIARVRGDKKVSALFSEAELLEVFSPERHLKQVQFIFDRVFGAGN